MADTFLLKRICMVKRRSVGVGVGAGLLLTASGLGAGPFVASAGAAGHATGAPINVSVEASVNTPIASIPQIFDGVRVAAKEINKGGGIRGHLVHVITCNSQLNPNQEVNCARTAVGDGVVADVGSQVFTNEAGVDSYLAGANTAALAQYVGGIPDYKGQGSAAFPLTFGLGIEDVCQSKALQHAIKAPLKVASVATEGLIAPSATPIIAASSKAQGTTAFSPVLTGLAATDFSPAVAQVAASHPNVLNVEVVPTQVPELITSAKAAGESWAFCMPDGYLTTSQLTGLATSGGPKYYFGALYPPPSAASHYPELAKYISQLRATGANVSLDLDPSGFSEGFNAWLGMQVFAQVAKSINGPITNSSFLEKLKQTKVNLGVLPPIDFGHAIAAAPYTRVFSAQAYLLTWNPAKKVTELVGSGPALKNAFAISGIGS